MFVASTFKGLEDERAALQEVFKAHSERLHVWGFEGWGAGEGAPDLVSFRKAAQADYLFLVLGGRYGSPAIHSGIGITEGEFDAFLYSHPAECCRDNPVLFVYQKHPASIGPRDSDVDTEPLERFRTKVNRRFTSPRKFDDWRDLQRQVLDIITRLPLSVPDVEYRKVSINTFEFKIFGIGQWREKDIRTTWSSCPCDVFRGGGCEYEEPLHYRPPKDLRIEMERHLGELWKRDDSDNRWQEEQPSFKTVRIRQQSAKGRSQLVLEFCHSTWHQFLGTNQAAAKEWEIPIRQLLKRAPDGGCDLPRSPFSNNLGFAVAVIDTKAETVYYSKRKLVSIHSGKKSTAVGSQLHAYDRSHVKRDGVPSLFSAVRKELKNEANIHKHHIRDLYVAAWGVGTRTGTPEMLFICDSERPLQKIEEDVCAARVAHFSEFDQLRMKSEGKNVVLDYELLADLRECADDWEPESAVACCLALDKLVPGCVSM